MNSLELTLLITASIIYLLILALIAYVFIRQPGQVTITQTGDQYVPQVSPTPPVSFIFGCKADSDCDPAYQCDPFYNECRVRLGGSCVKASDCAMGNYCSGVCIDKGIAPNYLTGELKDPCPCMLNGAWICTNGAQRYCVLTAGQGCNQNDQCFSELCSNGKCANSLPNGSPCSVSENDQPGKVSQCTSGHCAPLSPGSPTGYCQPTNLNNGDVGAYCNSVDGPGCSSGNACQNNVCLPADSSLLFSCGLNSACPSSMGCFALPLYGMIGQNYGIITPFGICKNAVGSNCACLYNTVLTTSNPSPQPNVPPDGASCVDGYAVKNGYCAALSGQSCRLTTDCYSGSCGNGPALYKFNPTPVTNFPTTGIAGIQNIKYTPFAIDISHHIIRIVAFTSGMSIIPAGTNGNLANMLDPQTGTDSVYLLVTVGTDPKVYLYEAYTGNTIATDYTDLTGTYTLKDADGVALGGNYVQIYLVYTFTPALGGLAYDVIQVLDSNYVSRPYLTSDGYQGMSTINFISTVDFVEPLVSGQSTSDISTTMLIFAPGVGASGSLYYKPAKAGIFGALPTSTYLPNINKSKIGPKYITMTYGFNIVNDNYTIYPLISYIDNSGPLNSGDGKLIFSPSLDNALVDTFGTFYLPDYLYGDVPTPGTDRPLCRSYRFSNTNSASLGTNNGFVIGTVHAAQSNTGYYVSNSLSTYIPGYFSDDSVTSTTARNVYIYNPTSCMP